MQKSDDMFELTAALFALHQVVGDVERKAARVVWQAPPHRRAAVIDCVMEKIKQLMDGLKACADAQDTVLRQPPAPPAQPSSSDESAVGVPPKCRAGFHEEYGICVPDY